MIHLRLSLTMVLFFIFVNNILNSCTTAIVSGKFTIDGRPLLLKHRDSDFLQNKLVYFTDGKYNYIGLVNSEDVKGLEVWAGCNSAGFAIMNSASYNLKLNDTTKLADKEGEIIKKALQSCATVDEFEKLLISIPKPLGVEANFGVIDAFGNGAYFETNNFTFTKFDVNDPKIAPNGYIIRTNYSFAGEKNKGSGYIRYFTAEELFQNASKNNELSFEFLIQKVSRCLKHSLIKKDLYRMIPENSNEPFYIHFEDFIPRYISTSSVVVQGVRPGEKPEFSTIWTILGFPLSSIAIPTWVAGGKNIPSILNTPNLENAPMCDASLKLKSKIFSFNRDGFKKYIDVSVLINKQNDGILQKIFLLEKNIMDKTQTQLFEWNKNGFSENNIQSFYGWIDEYVKKKYKLLFDIEL